MNESLVLKFKMYSYTGLAVSDYLFEKSVNLNL